MSQSHNSWLTPAERDDVAVQTAEAAQKAARESKRTAEAVESGKSFEQRKADQIRRIRAAYKKTGQDYDAEQAKRAYQAGLLERHGASTNPVPGFFRDLANWNDPDARRRVYQDAVDPAARAGATYRTGVNTTTTSGGEFALVKNASNYIVDAFANGVQSESVLQSLLTPWPMPEFGIHVSTPTVSTPSGAGSVGEGSSASNTDPVTALVASPKVTIGGRLNVSAQLLDLGGMTAEQFIAQELGASNGGEFERQIAVGGGTNELVGLFGTSGISTTVYTDAAPKPLAYLTALGKAMATFATNRKRVPDAIVVSPRRWAFLSAPQDSTTQSAFNNATTPLRSNGATRGLVGSFGGIAIYASAGIPATQGGSSNEDRPLLLYSPDLWLLTTPVNFKVTEQGGTTLNQVAVAYRYAALVVRQPSAIGTMTGSGAILPAGFYKEESKYG